MKVFCDLHHGDLYYSLQLLFEKRLGFEMYRPIGLEWYHQKYWHVYPHIDTANQYLGLNYAIEPPKDIHGNYLEGRDLLNGNYRFEDGIYYVKDPTKDKVQRAITLEKFKEMDFDILISSIPQHIDPFNKLIQLYQPKAKHIFQIGNSWQHRPGIVNVLSSTSPFAVPPGVNVCFYHQEFDLDVYQYHPPTVHKRMNSYIHYMKQVDLLHSYRSALGPDWTGTAFGSGMEDCIHRSERIAQEMRDSGWTWHIKPGGDGYGHILHNSYACGRPLVVNKSYYRGQIGEQLMIHGVTCIDISNMSVHDGTTMLRKLSHPDEHRRICENAYNRFKEVVDFDAEEVKIRKFLENLR